MFLVSLGPLESDGDFWHTLFRGKPNAESFIFANAVSAMLHLLGNCSFLNGDVVLFNVLIIR